MDKTVFGEKSCREKVQTKVWHNYLICGGEMGGLHACSQCEPYSTAEGGGCKFSCCTALDRLHHEEKHYFEIQKQHFET